MSRKQLTVQYAICIVLLIAGITLLFMGFLVDPLGIISNSVLVAFGEISTFAGSIIGIDYNYKIKVFRHTNKDEDDDEDQEF